MLTETSRKVAQTRFFESGTSQEKQREKRSSVKYLVALIFSQFSKRGLDSWELTFKVIVPLILYIFLEQAMCFAPRNAYKCLEISTEWQCKTSGVCHFKLL